MSQAEDELDARLQQLVADAKESSVVPGRDPVNQAMIRHWCDAMGDDNPVYTMPELAAGSVHGEIVAPPTMLQAWSMRGLERRSNASGGEPARGQSAYGLLDAAGYTSVVATDCEQKYFRYLKLDDEIGLSQKLESVTGPKKTGLGPGYFVTNLMTFRDQASEVVAEMRFRLLKFKPPAAANG
jgi:hypothetical protein